MLQRFAHLPRPLFVILTILLLPIILFVDGVGYLCGWLKVGDQSTWDDELTRIAHKAREVEISRGLMNFVYLGITPYVVQVFSILFMRDYAFDTGKMLVYTLIWWGFAICVLAWTIKQGIDPVDGVRRSKSFKD